MGAVRVKSPLQHVAIDDHGPLEFSVPQPKIGGTRSTTSAPRSIAAARSLGSILGEIRSRALTRIVSSPPDWMMGDPPTMTAVVTRIHRLLEQNFLLGSIVEIGHAGKGEGQ